MFFDNWFRKRYQNNPKLALVRVKKGDDFKVYEGVWEYGDSCGEIYRYKIEKGASWRVCVPIDYPNEFEDGRRIIGVMGNSLHAHTISMNGPLKTGVADVSALIEGDVITSYINSLSGGKVNKWLWLFIGLIIAGAAFGAYYLYSNQHKPAATTPVEQPASPTPASPDYQVNP